MNITSGAIKKPQKFVVYGPEGIGKSTFAAQFPDPVFIDTEGSTTHMDVRRFDAPSSWQMLLDEVGYVIKNPDVCATLVLDTADWAEKLCIDSVLAKYQKHGIEDFNYGKGYVYIMETFGKLLDLLTEVIDKGVNVVITAHAKMRKFEQPDEMGAYDRWEMKLSKQVAPIVKEWADIVLFATYKTIVVKEGSGDNAKAKAQGGRRIMHTTHHPCWDAKNRHDLPDELPFDYSHIAHIPLTKNAASRQSCEHTDSGASTQTVMRPDNGVKSNKRELSAAQPETTAPNAPQEIVIPEELPKALRDLMRTNAVSEEEIRLAVSNKGFYPYDTPIANYDRDFIGGALIEGWNDLLPVIISNRDLPF